MIYEVFILTSSGREIRGQFPSEEMAIKYIRSRGLAMWRFQYRGVVTEFKETSRALFVSDVKDGCHIQCEKCGYEQVVGKVPFPLCGGCGRQLVYPAGASW